MQALVSDVAHAVNSQSDVTLPNEDWFNIHLAY